MEVYSTGVANPMYQKAFFNKKAEDYKMDPERFKKDVEKTSLPKVTKTIYRGLNNYKEDLNREQTFINGLFLSKFFMKFVFLIMLIGSFRR
jgi:hypothetical protein